MENKPIGIAIEDLIKTTVHDILDQSKQVNLPSDLISLIGSQ